MPPTNFENAKGLNLSNPEVIKDLEESSSVRIGQLTSDLHELEDLGDPDNKIPEIKLEIEELQKMAA